MKRHCCVFAAVLGFATASGAATLKVTSDALSYNVGQTITLNVLGTNTGESTTNIIGQVLFDATLTDNPFQPHPSAGDANGAQIRHTFTTGQGTGNALRGSLDGSEGFQEVFDQVFNAGPVTVNENTTAFVQIVAANPGVVNVTWFFGGEFPKGGVEYFSISDSKNTNENVPVGTTFTIVPEPTTAALLGLGLFGLLLRGRRRS